jgi:hypothetical protein
VLPLIKKRIVWYISQALIRKALYCTLDRNYITCLPELNSYKQHFNHDAVYHFFLYQDKEMSNLIQQGRPSGAQALSDRSECETIK